MRLVVTCTSSPVRSAYLANAVAISASLTSGYNNLAGLEDGACSEFVRHTASRLVPGLKQLGGRVPEIIPGDPMRVLDGNHLSATRHRLPETRADSAAPLPGQSLVIYEPAWPMATAVILWEDGHAQERSLLDQVVGKLRERDLWLADRNFRVKHFLLAIAKANGFSINRRHEQLTYLVVNKLRRRGRVETGQVYEQPIGLADEEGKLWWLRRVVLVLDDPTRDGDQELALLTTLPQEVSAKTVADAYRNRWRSRRDSRT